MSEKQESTFKCDLCGHESRVKTGAIPYGWISLEFDSIYEERAWFTKHVCGSCVVKIKNTPEPAPQKP